MKWRPFIHEGITYDLSHITPFYWHYTAEAGEKRPERTYHFQVTFSMHCFTRKALTEENIADNLWYQGPNERRVFCFDRHELSLLLPEIITSLNERTCWHTGHNNFFTIELATQEGDTAEYEIYFNVTKATRKGWLNLIVESAYVRTATYNTQRPKKRKIRLDVIAYNIQMNRKTRPGK